MNADCEQAVRLRVKVFALPVIAIALFVALNVGQGIAAVPVLFDAKHYAVLERGDGWAYRVFRHNKLRCFDLQSRSVGSQDCRPERAQQPDLGFGVLVDPNPSRSWVMVETSLQVQRVHLDLESGPDRDIYPTPIGARRARKARVHNDFKFAVISKSGCVGVEVAIAYDAAGAEVTRIPPLGIPPESLPSGC